MIKRSLFIFRHLFTLSPWKYRRKLVNEFSLFVYILTLLSFSIPSFNTQKLRGGLFPDVRDLSSFRPVKASSTCGLGNAQTYCTSSVSNDSLISCTQQTCDLQCCEKCGSSTPHFTDIGKDGTTSIGVYTSADRRPGSDVFSESKDIRSGSITSKKFDTSSNFTFTTWMKQSAQNSGLLISKGNIFNIQIKEYAMTFNYRTKDSGSITNTLKFMNVNFLQNNWHHIAVAVCGHDLALFIDGEVVRTGVLSGAVIAEREKLIIGQNVAGNNQFVGLLQDIKFYAKGLTNREVIESMNGTLVPIPYTHCRCPESYPLVSATNPFYCMKNDVKTGQLAGQLQRLSVTSHPVDYLADNEVITYWLSEKVNSVTLEFDLQFSRLQIYLVSITFYSPTPPSITIERSIDFGLSYKPWQHFAIDCKSSFNMDNNGFLPEPDSINCLQIPRPKASWEVITFQPAEAGPENRPQRPFGTPGCSDFHCSPKLMQFVQATNVKIILSGHLLATHPDHRYYGIRRVIIGGSCDCYGHGKICIFNASATPNPKYICQCDSRTNTEGEQCQRCLPLYRDKPFARGTILNANPCKACECHRHADSCYYNRTLDQDPNDRNKLGGGVCTGCKHNTIGRFCETCKPLFYRPSGKLINVTDVCQPCDCIGPGVVSGQLDCQKDDSTTGILAGQCKCKAFVNGRQCTECKIGYFKLSSTNLDGCSECSCTLAGTVNNDASCHISSGQCNCKINVIGAKCTNCKFGYYGLTSANPLGCSPCNCNPLGADLAASCHVTTGQCVCKDRYEGRACDRCKQGYYGPTCQVCSCFPPGTEGGSASLCNNDNGKCSCKLYVTGLSCNRCKTGYYGLSISNPTGCLPCNCDNKGTIGNSGMCDQNNGTCACKPQVAGRGCNICKVGTYGLNASNPDGCTRCNCSSRGTAGGNNTPQDKLVCTSKGQCSCLSNVVGKECQECAGNYYWNPNGLGCLPCICDNSGSTSIRCNTTGYCECKQDTGVSGMKCNECLPGYYGFVNGNCRKCNCLTAGSSGPRCDGFGKCTECKKNVQGLKCDTCRAGTSNLTANNPYGCSGAPYQQGPPFIISQSARSVSLAWLPPDHPNGAITKYDLYRDNSRIYSGIQRSFVDNTVKPHTNYSYYVVVYTSGGSAKSVDDLLHQTLSDAPEGVQPPNITQIQERSVVATWMQPAIANGKIVQYILQSISSSTTKEDHYSGLNTLYQVTGLNPFTIYSFSVTACTVGGCSFSSNTTVSTRSAAPDSQPAPYLKSLSGGASILVTWDAPAKPNGEIQFYDLFSRQAPFSGQGNTIALRLNPNIRNFTVPGLVPFTFYEFRVVSYTAQVEGSTSSNWTRIRTLEGVPAGGSSIQPNSISLNSTSIDLSWSEPAQPNGVIRRYEIFRYEQASNYLTPILSSSTHGTVFHTQINKLQPYTQYQFSVKACNPIGCTRHSYKVTARTRASAPQNQSEPSGTAYNSSSILLKWSVPEVANGPLPLNFIVEMVLPLFNYPPSEVEQGIRFPGFGYYQFPGSFIPDSATNQLEFSFKTRYLDGLIFFAASQRQEDIIVVEFRDGCPWFIFDTESGVVEFTITKNTTFNDNRWHHVLATRDLKEGKIVIDGIYSGSGTSTGLKNVIGQISNVFIGGLPNDFRIVRRDGTTLKRMYFIGCLKNFKYKNVLVNFKQAVKNVAVSPLSNFCPTSYEPGVYFKGGGFVVLKKGVFKGGKSFSIQLKFRTLQASSLLLYATGERVVFAVYFSNKTLLLKYKTATDAGIYPVSTLKLCDGGWHEVSVVSLAQQVSATLDGSKRQIASFPSNFVIDSEMFMGGVPVNSDEKTLQNLPLTQGFSGSLSDVYFGTAVHYQSAVMKSHNVELDGCPQEATTGSFCSNSVIQTVYDGSDMGVTVDGLNTFTEYLYRVRSYHTNIPGYAASEWIPIRSGEGSPQNLSKPIVENVNATFVILQWRKPAIAGGLITSYQLHSYHASTKENKSIQIDNVLSFRSVFHNLHPASLYYFTVEAFTAAGSVESEAVSATTLPAAPNGFSPPNIVSFPTSLNISWQPPLKPNGVILFYQVDIDNVKRYSGKNLHTYIDGLDVYRLYNVKVYVCGIVACATNTLQVYTGQLPPQGVVAPQLRVLGSRRIEVKWFVPTQKNGQIQRYEIFQALSTSSFDMISVFNATSSTYKTIISSLRPGTLYFFRVTAFTEAGGTLGDVSQVRTLESAPEQIPQPVVSVVNSTALLVKVRPPKLPNGVINRYVLLQNGANILQTSTLPDDYLSKNLHPYSRHTFQVEACTSKGCGYSDPIEVYTGHAPPVGNIVLTATILDSYSAQASWTAVQSPNGVVTYNLYVTGEFYIDLKRGYDTVNKTIVCISSNTTTENVVCDQLLAFEEYKVFVNASNDAGYILSNTLLLKTPADVPEGIFPPSVLFVNSTAIALAWSPPARVNGVIKKYTLYGYRETDILGTYSKYVLTSGLVRTYTITSLTPYTNYTFWIEVDNQIGKSSSNWTNVTTAEDVPTGLDTPKLSTVGSRYVILEISPPANMNGVLTQYAVYLNDSLKNNTLETTVLVSGLQPYVFYQLRVAACTKVGCINSSVIYFRSLQDVPEGMSAPILTTNNSRLVFVLWSKPDVSNGIIISYSIQRRRTQTNIPILIQKVNASFWNTYVDGTVEPYTSYDYRIIAETSVGGTPSPYNTIRTLQGEPEWMQSPITSAVSSSSISVKWAKPYKPNGIITHYYVKIAGRSDLLRNVSLFEYTLTGLQSYVRYSVVISACTIGGCGDSPPSLARTLPAKPVGQLPPSAEVLSNSSLRVRWQEPIFPGGPIQNYLLWSRVMESLVSENITLPTPWREIYEGVSTIFDDKDLGIYSLHQYMVICVTTEGNISSNASSNYRTGPGKPTAGPLVRATVFNHTTISVSWTDPPISQLQGDVQSYLVTYEVVRTSSVYNFGTFPGNIGTILIGNLRPSTTYDIRITLFNGAGSKESSAARTKTLAGVPEGFDKPIINKIEAYSLGIFWVAPRVPNGDITNYTIIVNDQKMDTVKGDVTYHHQHGLLPYTNYLIKIQVCTQYTCILSGSSTQRTNPAAPTNLSPPVVTALSPSSINIAWSPPLNKNGIMTGYQLYRRGYTKCSTKPTPKRKCTYVTCEINKMLCGAKCYDPKTQMCCGNKLYAKDARKTCCEQNYGIKNDVTDVCCGGQFFPYQSSYQCCYGYYRQVTKGHVCCTGDNGVVVGVGNSCCGDVPYDTNGSKTCLCGGLYDKFPMVRKCCGGKIVSIAETCCGNSARGKAYTLDPSKSCCGTYYVPSSSSLCCKNDIGMVKVYNYTQSSLKQNHKCCDTSRILNTQQCCTTTGYDNSTSVCADRSSLTVNGCGDGKVCSLAQKATSYCNRCDFDVSKHVCGYVAGYYDETQNVTEPGICVTLFKEILENRRNPSILSFVDTALIPHTKYEYYVIGFNTAGNVTSGLSSTHTLMSRPEGLLPPVPTVISSSQIAVVWSPPTKPNGQISEYRLFRIKWITKEGVLLYTGVSTSHLDEKSLQPYTGYMYVLSVCTNQCTNISATDLVYTQQSVPENVKPPLLTAESAYMIRVEWSLPRKPNGVIVRYNVTQLIDGHFESILPKGNLGEMMMVEVKNLKPYTLYTFRVEACTQIGCTIGPAASERTLQAAPEGVNPPRVVVIGARTVEVEWTEPTVTNGVISYYVLYRNASVVYNNTGHSFIDNTVSPATLYTYSVEVYNAAGGTLSTGVSVVTPESSPQGIPVPVLYPLSSTSINVSWSPPLIPNGVIVKYAVFYQEIDDVIFKEDVGLLFFKILVGLKAFTLYRVRIEACTVRGCGTGDRGTARTFEGVPQGQAPPTFLSTTSSKIELKWNAPSLPNGNLTKYKVDRRQPQGPPFLIYMGNRTDYIDSQLQPYTVYEYRVQFINSVGVAESKWVTHRTLESIPQDFAAPKIDVINSTAVRATWTNPGRPNGILKSFSIRARKFSQLGDERVVKCCIQANIFTTVVNGFLPATRYEFQVGATTSAGTGYSGWTIERMKEALPSGIPILKADTNPDGNNNGRSMEVYWDPPEISNGVVLNYILYEESVVVYQGLQRKALVRRRLPFTNYTFQLAVCNSAGCRTGPKQVLTSGEIIPRGLIPPTSSFSNSTSVLLQWRPPLSPNGKINLYQVIREQVAKLRRRRAEVIIHSTNNTNIATFSYLDNSLQPFTSYRYKLRAFNSQGSVDSDWFAITTSEDAPQHLSSVNATALIGPSVLLEWLPPAQPNGIIRHYDILRNESRIDSTSATSYVDKTQELKWNTLYWYQVSACTLAGCTKSRHVTVVTVQSAPKDMLPPSLVALSPTRVEVKWQPPLTPNGKINIYKLFLNDEVTPLFQGDALEFNATGLRTFTTYSFSVSACTVEGCTKSRPSSVTTREDLPEHMPKPVLYVIGATVIDASWSPPQKPNGVILYYVLLRDGNFIYNGTDNRFTDRTVSPGRTYGYTVTVYNSAGGTTSQEATSPPTDQSAPENVTTPTLKALTSSSILATWTPPGISNGVVIRYLVLYDNKEIDVGTVRTHIGRALKPYTMYEFRVKACTLAGCTSSQDASARTLESAPSHQPVPTYPIASIKSDSIGIIWNEPRQPNGAILRYELFRKGEINDTLVYSGPDKSVTDSGPDITSETTYLYKVVSYNSVGRAESAWSEVTTRISTAVPHMVSPVTVPPESIGDTYFSVIITPPGKSNGIILKYVVELVGLRNVTTNLTNSLILVSELQPVSNYTVRLHACNAIGCGVSSDVLVVTKMTAPDKFINAPLIKRKTSVEIEVTWLEPLYPNGEITKYEVLLRLVCPQQILPNCQTNTKRYSAGTSRSYNVTELSPYTLYNISVEAFNAVGSTSSPSTEERTLASSPVLVEKPSVRLSEASKNTIIVDWSSAFDLRSKLVRYELYENNILGFSGTDVVASRPNRPVGSYIYTVKVFVDVNGVEQTLITDEVSIDVGTVATAGALSSDTPWYKTVWFLALCALAGVLAIFLLLVCYCRSCKGDRTVYVRQREPLPIKNKYGQRESSVDAFSEKAYRQDRVSSRNESLSRYNTVGFTNEMLPLSPTLRYDSTRERFGPLSAMSESKINENYINDDLVWETTANGRDLDSGLYDESPTSFDEELDDTPPDNDLISVQHERILFPDTHL